MSFDHWLEVDQELGEPQGPEIVLSSVGLTVWEKKRKTHAPWDSVLGVAQVDSAVYVLVPREPPRPPWIEISDERARKADTSLDAIASSIEARLASAVGYRGRRHTRPLVSPEELQKRMVSRDPVPGTVEVPVGEGPWEERFVPRWVERAFLASASGGTGGFGGLYAGLLLGGIWGMNGVIACAIGGATVGSIFAIAATQPKDGKARPRVLALAPDGCVAGLPSGVRSFAWSELAPFRIEKRRLKVKGRMRTADHLVFQSPDGTELGAVHQSWFAESLELIVRVAEAYRARFGGPKRGLTT
jgi:hypothetical protein